WIIILLSNLKLDPHYASQHLGITMKRPTGALLSYVTIGLIILTIAGATIHLSERIGVLFSLSMASLIFISARIKELSGAPGGLVPARKPYRDN
ncbi:MAG TPA: hypothetical protein DER60_14325, partial [Syntrophomonas sp.]|nr:hypothetical protein [Syntrophomonas sp.]